MTMTLIKLPFVVYNFLEMFLNDVLEQLVNYKY